MIHDQVAHLYCEGVEAIRKATVSIGADGWSRPACGNWNADDTARHLLAVAR